jgi:hypothetical protein
MERCDFRDAAAVAMMPHRLTKWEKKELVSTRNIAPVIEPLESRSLMVASPLDLSFGNGTGEVHLPLGIDAVVSAGEVETDGKLVLVGYTRTFPRDVLVMRVLADGSFDWRHAHSRQ